MDLRLWDRSLMKRIYGTLVAILERETRGWFLHFRERLIAELRAQKMPDEDIERVSSNKSTNTDKYYCIIYLLYIFLLYIRKSMMLL